MLRGCRCCGCFYLSYLAHLSRVASLMPRSPVICPCLADGDVDWLAGWLTDTMKGLQLCMQCVMMMCYRWWHGLS